MSRKHFSYNTKNFAGYGLFLLIVLILLLFLGRLLIPPLSINTPLPQMSTLNGISLKFDESPAVSLFIRSIKSHHGYLCLGTSESGDLPDGNYYDFLNNDTTIEPRFSVLAGAGRTCGIFIPVLLRHRKEVDSLNIIYLINPVYWRTDLANVSVEYWSRYMTYQVCNNTSLSPTEQKNYYQPVNAYLAKLNIFQKAVFSAEYELRESRKSFFQDLKYMLNPSSYQQTFSYLPEKKLSLTHFKNFGVPDYNNIDTTWNIERSFTNKEWYKHIDDKATYRYTELTSFIHTCRDLGINTLFILGPYNGRFIEQYDKISLTGYQQTTNKIRDLLISENVHYIDASKQSFTPGAFIDHQHYSSYGAYLLYKQLKSLLNAKKIN